MKRLKKADREAAEIAAIERRLRDIAAGANSGGDVDDAKEGYGPWSMMGPAEFFSYVKAVRSGLAPSDGDEEATLYPWGDCAWQALHLAEILAGDEFADVAAKLHGYGARA